MQYILLLLVMLTTTSCEAQAENLNNISELMWKNRVILLLSSDDDKRNQQLFAKYKEAVIDRDLVWFIVQDTQVISNYQGGISMQFVERTKDTFPLNKYRVLLIGKDGGIKLRAQQLDITELISTIDSMPMRQQEMLQQND
ncbi:hypothetical protein DS885_07535 [Psychromonas sp. B3M02]|uniref:DUF4174 domain-containing protein n=1 Tax=Psychromonas sp. B3M02 TaxID=2267226 RepID=UPI000DE8819B|nr:DUF4174 domain-containing protein [Psychromonas sp. B3M02]RBW46611.1 hypothetical protein DS885_07535 [Psychromonas sp. B3M02]